MPIEQQITGKVLYIRLTDGKEYFKSAHDLSILLETYSPEELVTYLKTDILATLDPEFNPELLQIDVWENTVNLTFVSE